MAKLTRVFQKIFGSSAGVNQIAEFGSLAAASPAFTTDPAVVQSLPNYSEGWFAAVIGGNSPAIEDMNALFFVDTYQLAYLMQAGIPEWDASTTYYIGSFASDSGGGIYFSITNNNTGNPLTDTANWTKANGVRAQDFTADGTWTAPSGVFKVRATATTYLFNQIACNGDSSIANISSFQPFSWGLNSHGELGLGDVTPRSSPVLVLGTQRYRQVSLTGASALGIIPGGDAYAVGLNTYGELGDGTVTPRSSPVLVLGGNSYRMIAGGSPSTAGIDAYGDLYAWGSNADGQLGDSTVVAKSSPVLVLESRKWIQVAVSDAGGADASMMGLSSTGDLYGWGFNGNGELGVNDIIPRSSPVLVVGGYSFKQIAGSGRHFLGITISGDLYAWGRNDHGQLGTNDTSARSSPTLVVGGYKFRQVSAGDGDSAGITESGDLYTWGNNSSGQLGDSTTTDRSSPVLVNGGLKYVQVASGGGNTLAIASDTTLYAWGDNGSGQLGVGDTTNRLVPTLVNGGLSFPCVYQAVENSIDISVTPGNTYDVKVFGVLALFGYTALFQDQYGTGASPMKVTLEY